MDGPLNKLATRASETLGSNSNRRRPLDPNQDNTSTECNWDEIRSSRSKGGYPWTHLYKEPLEEDLDPEPFTMEGLRKAKSSSTVGKSDIEIFDVTDFELDTSLPPDDKMDTSQIVTETDDHSINKNTGSVSIEECEMGESSKQQPDTVIDPSDSLDNISQYLDKEDRGPILKNTIDKETSTPNTKSEEKENERKRKLSAESSYSRLSQTKSALMKKIEDTKKKIKIPKLAFTASKIKRPALKKTKNSPPEIKKETNKKPLKDRNNHKDVKPVYLYIPLKPPEGQEDEFSRLESQDQTESSEDNKIEEPKKVDVFKKMGATKKFSGFKNLVKQIQESKLEDIPDKDPTDPVKVEDTLKSEETVREQKDTDDKKDTQKDYPQQGSENEEPKGGETEDQTREDDISKTEFSLKTKTPSFTIGSDEELSEVDDNEEEKPGTSESKPDIFEHLFHMSATKKLKEENELKPEQQVRSKSVEPERKRKYSLESSYSRKSLSKLSLMKKLKDASEKIKSKLSRSTSKQQVQKTEKEEPVKVSKPSKKKETSKPKPPVYIHIPLKPPEGETDEFSYLQQGEKQQSVDSEISSTPDSVTKSGVQFIILTAPSDDEILDYNSSDVPETPSSENKLFFPTKVTELKQLAKQVVDEVAAPKPKLDSVEEEANGEKTDDGQEELEKQPENAEIIKEPDTEDKKDETTNERKTAEVQDLSKDDEKKKTLVDEEDGLSEIKFLKPSTDAAIEVENIQEKVEETTPELKSSIKMPDSPKIKKKVSFKRRSKASREDSYEDIQAPDSENIRAPLSTTPHIVAVQEKLPLTVKKEQQEPHVSFAEEPKEWSNNTDHEYEPVNPPPDDFRRIPEVNPSIYITDIDYDTSILPLGTVTIDPTPTLDIDKKNENDTLRKTEDMSQTQGPSDVSVNERESANQSPETKEPQAANFQAKIRRQSQNLKAKFQNIKKPTFNKPEFKRPEFKKPEFKKFKIEKPKFHIPKIPETAKISLPSFSLGRKHSEKRSLKERQASTEANDGDSKKQFFDFSTYPRIFKKKQRPPKQLSEEENGVEVGDIPSFATAPRTKKNGKNGKKKEKWGGSVTIRIPLHSEDSMDKVEQDDLQQGLDTEEKGHEPYPADEEIADRPMDSSHIRYDEDIDIDDEFDNENNEIDRERDFVDRWNKGMFNQNINENELEYLENFKNSNYKVTDLDSPDDKPATDFEEANNENNIRYLEFEQDQNQNNNRYSKFDPTNNGNNTRYSSGSSFGHRRGVLEEIDSDEFIYRPKGISQEHINIFASPEMRQAFQQPINTLLEMEKIQDTNHNFSDSRRSIPEENNKRKPIRKPKRVKTPHTSNDQIAQSEELTDDLDELPPSRPRRRSRRKKQKNQEDVIPYRETIHVDDDDIPMIDDRLNDHRESLGILGDDEQDEESLMSENDKIDTRLEDEIRESNQFQQYQYDRKPTGNRANLDEGNLPAIPPRKQKSIKSLNLSENGSLFDDISYNRAVSEDLSIGCNDIEPEIEAIRTESKIIIPIHQDLPPPPKKPSRTRSRTSLQSNPVQQFTDEQTIFNDIEYKEPCVEPPCIQDIRDPMGYAIIDKSKIRDPPLPPPRLPPRQKKISKIDEENKFFTVPRSSGQNMPVRPLRNYSTLGQIKKSTDRQNTYENKENIDITQYIEIEDEPSRHLQSGDVIRKMKDRPLPPPPRPPRKSRPLKDITSLENIPHTTEQLDKTKLEETEVSTQTEPLPDDFICDELVQEPTDKIIIPTSTRENLLASVEQVSPNSDDTKVVREKLFITPTSYTYEEETITHGSILVEPLNGAIILQESELQKPQRERVVPIANISDDETSSIPEDFKKLSDFPQEQSKKVINSGPVMPEVIKTQKLQVTDLDVDTLSVNKLVADKIICSDIESDSIRTADITSKNSAFKFSDITLPPSFIEEIIKSITFREPVQEHIPTSREPVQEHHLTSRQPVQEHPLTSREPVQEHHLTSRELEQEHPLTYREPVQEHPLTSKQPVQEHPLTSREPEQEHSPEPNCRGEEKKTPVTEQPEDLVEGNKTNDEILENLICDKDNFCQDEDVPEQNSTSADQLNFVQPNISEREEVQKSDENVEIKVEESDVPPIPPPRANSEQVASRLPKRTNQTVASPPQERTLEPEVDDEPPPRPPEPQLEYIPSQPPASFYALKAQKYVDDNIPVAPRRKRHTRSRARSKSSSDESSTAPVSRRFPRRYSELPISQLSGQLIRACGNEVNHSLKRLITYLTNNVLGNVDGTQDLNVMILIVLVLIAGLILLGYGNEKTVVHLHHWEYFNPPKDL